MRRKKSYSSRLVNFPRLARADFFFVSAPPSLFHVAAFDLMLGHRENQLTNEKNQCDVRTSDSLKIALRFIDAADKEQSSQNNAVLYQGCANRVDTTSESQVKAEAALLRSFTFQCELTHQLTSPAAAMIIQTICHCENLRISSRPGSTDEACGCGASPHNCAMHILEKLTFNHIPVISPYRIKNPTPFTTRLFPADFMTSLTLSRSPQ